MAASSPGQPTKMAGQVRASGSGKPSEATKDGPKPGPVVPQVVDRESSQQPPAKESDEASPQERQQDAAAGAADDDAGRRQE